MFQVWELSDLDRDGMLDRDEFSVVSLHVVSARAVQSVNIQHCTGFIDKFQYPYSFLFLFNECPLVISV